MVNTRIASSYSMHEPKYSFVSFGGLMRLIVFVHFVTVQDMYHPGGEDAFI
jgi:hypothetical protein